MIRETKISQVGSGKKGATNDKGNKNKSGRKWNE